MSAVTECRPNARLASFMTDPLATRIRPDKMPLSGFFEMQAFQAEIADVR